MQFQILLADKVIEVRTIHSQTYRMCEEYLCSGRTPDISVEISEEDLVWEREMARKNDLEEGNEPIGYSNEYLETLAVYRKIANRMLDFKTFLMHGSVVASGDGAVMFTASSGTGKTTRTRLWLDLVPDSYVVNGDKPLIKMTDTEVLACGTPWSGKEQLQTNRQVPLKAIFFLERAEENSIEELKLSDAVPFLLPQIYKPKEQTGIIKTLMLLRELNGKVRCFKYRSNREKETIEMAYQAAFGIKLPTT